MSVAAIGAGFGRTGAVSLRQALEVLGPGPTHHMHEVMDGEDQKRTLAGICEGQDARLVRAVCGLLARDYGGIS